MVNTTMILVRWKTLIYFAYVETFSCFVAYVETLYVFLRMLKHWMFFGMFNACLFLIVDYM